MLILTRRKGQSILINDDIEIIVTAIDGDQIKLGVQAPAHVKIVRKEILEAVQNSNKEAAAVSLSIDEVRKIVEIKDFKEI